ncbi:MAG: hypothetical protein HY900_22900 [Deltaproteobacteria bacterium]|nr:hypothetical protein [Deltaproteobacteria bacterium]
MEGSGSTSTTEMDRYQGLLGQLVLRDLMSQGSTNISNKLGERSIVRTYPQDEWPAKSLLVNLHLQREPGFSCAGWAQPRAFERRSNPVTDLLTEWIRFTEDHDTSFPFYPSEAVVARFAHHGVHRSAALGEYYEFLNTEEIGSYLRRNKDLEGHLIAIAQKIPEYLPATTLRLELSDKDQNLPEQLVIYLILPEDAPNPAEALFRMDMEWWLPLKSELGKRVSINFDF